MNTLLENAIQEAMAELDKKSEGTSTRDDGPDDECVADTGERVDATHRHKRHDKPRNRDKHKKNSLKMTLVASPNKSSDGTRLRSSR